MSKDKPTGALPKVVNGVTFRCYRTGIMQTEWRSDDDKYAAGQIYRGGTYWARFNGRYLQIGGGLRRFRKLERAMLAAVK